MPSSPTETSLVEIAVLYGRAIGEVRRGDLEAADRILTEVDSLLVDLADPESDNEIESVGRRSAREALDGLVGVLADELQATATQVESVRRGRKALVGYGNRQRIVGTRVEKDL